MKVLASKASQLALAALAEHQDVSMGRLIGDR
jgi:hypothetical protein